MCSAQDFTEKTKVDGPIGVYTGDLYFPVSRRGKESGYDVGLAAFANSSWGSGFAPNCRRETIQGPEASGYLPHCFLKVKESCTIKKGEGE